MCNVKWKVKYLNLKIEIDSFFRAIKDSRKKEKKKRGWAGLWGRGKKESTSGGFLFIKKSGGTRPKIVINQSKRYYP